MSFFFGSSEPTGAPRGLASGVDPERVEAAWNYMKDHSFGDIGGKRRDRSNDEAAIAFDFFFRSSETVADFGNEWDTHWLEHLAVLPSASREVHTPHTTVANTYNDSIESFEKVQSRLELFIKAGIESAEDSITDEKTDWRVVHSKLAGQTVLSTEYLASFCKRIPEIAKASEGSGRAFSNVFISEWLELKSILADLLLLARRDFQLNGPLLSGRDLLVEDWKDATHSLQQSMGEAFDEAWNLMKAENYTSTAVDTLSPDSLISHYHKQLDFLAPGSDNVYREMEIRYFLDKVHAPKKEHSAPLDTKGVHKDRLAELRAAGLKGWVLQKLKGLSALADFAKTSCPCVAVGTDVLLSAEDVAASLKSLSGGSYTSYKGNYEAWKLQLRKDQFLYPMNLDEFPQLFKEEGGLDFRAPFVKEQTESNPGLRTAAGAIDSAIFKIFADDKDLMPFNKESLMPFLDLAPGSGTQTLSPYTLHFRTGAQVCGPLLSETPKAFLNIYKKSDNLASVPSEGAVLLVAWDELHYSRLLGWNQMTEGYQTPEGCYYLNDDPKGGTLSPGYSIPAQCASDCEYWNRLDWTKFVDKNPKVRGKYVTDRVLKSRKILERILAGAREPVPTAASLNNRWNPTLLIRVLEPGECCALPKSHMGYMIFTLGSASALLERNFLFESMVPSTFLRSTLIISGQSEYPAYQPRSYSEGAFAAIIKACGPETKDLLKKWIKSSRDIDHNAKIQITPSFGAATWGLTRDRHGEIPWKSLVEDNSLKNRSASYRVAEWKLVHEDTRSLLSPVFHDPDWFKGWKDSGFLPQAVKDMVLGNFSPAYLVESLLSISPSKRTLVSNDTAKISVVGSPVYEDGKPSTQEIITTEYVNYQGLWMRGNRIQILENGSVKLEFLQVLNVIYPFKEPGMVVVGKDKRGNPIEETEPEQHIAGLVPRLRWLLIRGDQYSRALYDMLIQTGADKRLKDSPEIMSKGGNGLGDLWAPLFRGTALTLSPEDEKALINRYPWEDETLLKALVRGQTTEEDTAIFKTQSVKLADRFLKTRPATLRLVLERAAEIVADKGVPDAKTMLQKLRSDPNWFESDYFFTRKVPGGKTLNPAFFDVFVEFETALSAEYPDVIKVWLGDSTIPLQSFCLQRLGLNWFQSFPVISSSESENLTPFTAASAKVILSGADLEAAAQKLALKMLPGAIAHEREDRKEEKELILLHAEDPWVDNQGIDAFIGSSGNASQFVHQIRDSFKDDSVRKTALDSWKANRLDRDALALYPALKKLEAIGKYAVNPSSERKGKKNTLKTLEDEITEILSGLESMTSPDNVDTESKKAELRPDIRRANVLLDSVFARVLGIMALAQPRIRDINRSVSSRPVQSIESSETKASEAKKEKEAKKIAESIGLSMVDLVQEKTLISESRGDSLLEAAKRKRREYLAAWVYGADEKEIAKISDILEDKFTRNFLPAKERL